MMKEQFDYAKKNLEKLHHKNRIPRFSLCEWCGKLQHFLYGTVEADEAREIITVINNSSQAIKENRKIIYNTTRIVEAILDEQEKKVIKFQENLRDFYMGVVTKNDKRWNRRDLISITDSLISEFKTLTYSIDQAFTAQSTGQIPKIIQSENFIAEFHSILKSLKQGQTFPINIFEDNISEMFKIATLRVRRVDNTILLKITLPICETEPHTLFKATQIPIVTDGAYLIASIENNYFIVNEKQTEFTEMTDSEIENGIYLNEFNMLYKVRILTE